MNERNQRPTDADPRWHRPASEELQSLEHILQYSNHSAFKEGFLDQISGIRFLERPMDIFSDEATQYAIGMDTAQRHLESKHMEEDDCPLCNEYTVG